MQLNSRIHIFLLLVALLATSSPAHAYLGPGLSLGAILIVVGVVFSVGLALYGLLWFPLKRRLRASKTEQRVPGQD